nr:DUF3817 domain-containing protein [Kocuria sp. KRD140]
MYRIAATAEAVTWALLILGMIAKYGFGAGDLPVRLAGGIHGFVFLSYCVSTVVVWTDRRWPAATGVLGLVLSVVPFATVPFERHAERKGLLADEWRVAPAGHARTGAGTTSDGRVAGDDDARATSATPGGVPSGLREPARTPAERLLAVILRWPVLSALALLVFVVALFSVLLTAGPPTEWFS